MGRVKGNQIDNMLLPISVYRNFSLCLFFGLLVGAVCAEESPWDKITLGLFNEADGVFEEIATKSKGETARQALYGRAVALLNIQPRTQGNVEKSQQLFESIYQANTVDDLGLAARFMQARISQIHLLPVNKERAEQIYTELSAGRPNHAITQRAKVKLTLLRIYATGIDETERRNRFVKGEEWATGLSELGPRAQIHLLLAETAQRLGYGMETELKHLLAAESAGIIKLRLRADVLVRIGDLARILGDEKMARAYYRIFLKDYPRTDRRTTVEGYLKMLDHPITP